MMFDDWYGLVPSVAVTVMLTLKYPGIVFINASIDYMTTM